VTTANRLVLAGEWTIATAAALVLTHFGVEMIGAAYLGWALLFILPILGGGLGGLPVAILQWIVIRRRLTNSGSWVVLTFVGFVLAGWVAVALAAVLFVPYQGLSTGRTFACVVVAAPIVGLVQAAAVRRWSCNRWIWILASAVAWTTFAAVELFENDALANVNSMAGRLVSAAAGFLASSDVGATLLGGSVAGAITGIALAFSLPPDTPSKLAG
jgi:hypothetical protein